MPTKLKNFFNQYKIKYVLAKWQDWVIYHISRGRAIEQAAKGLALAIEGGNSDSIALMKSRYDATVALWNKKETEV